MTNFLKYYSLGFRYQDLDRFVIDKDNCCLCGLCSSICDVIGLKENTEVFLEKPNECSECSQCLKFCTQGYFPNEVFDKELFNNGATKHDLLGYSKKITVAKSKDKKVLEVAQNGGIVTTLLIHALNTGLIDGVLLTTKDENWIPKPFVARTEEEILKGAGSLYTIVPSFASYAQAVNEYKLKKLAFVGMPCQIQAARKLQLDSPLSDECGKIVLTIGLLCSSNFSYDLLKKKLEEDLKIPINTVKKFDIGRGKFFIYTKAGETHTIPIKYTKALKWPSCLNCKDYAAEYADISAGSVGAPSDDTNSVFIRTDVGEKLWKDAVKAKMISEQGEVNMGSLESNAERKHKFVKAVENNLLNIDDYEKFMDLILSNK